MGWFGPSKDEVWQRLAPWTVALDTDTESSGESSVTYTRVRAPCVNPHGFRFTVYRKGFLSEFGKPLGMQDIEVGDPDFDEAFIVQGNDEARVRTFLLDPKLRALIRSRPEIQLSIKDCEGWFGPRFPEDVDELHFLVVGVIEDVERLKALFELFSVALERLCRIGSCREESPVVAPRGIASWGHRRRRPVSPGVRTGLGAGGTPGVDRSARRA